MADGEADNSKSIKNTFDNPQRNNQRIIKNKPNNQTNEPIAITAKQITKNQESTDGSKGQCYSGW